MPAFVQFIWALHLINHLRFKMVCKQLSFAFVSVYRFGVCISVYHLLQFQRQYTSTKKEEGEKKRKKYIFNTNSTSIRENYMNGSNNKAIKLFDKYKMWNANKIHRISFAVTWMSFGGFSCRFSFIAFTLFSSYCFSEPHRFGH